MATLAALSRAIEARDPYSSGHCARVTVLAELIALRLGWDEGRLVPLRLGAGVHDVGKLAVSQTVLLKREPLTDAEFGEMRIHPVAGARLLWGIAEARPALPFVLYHHERWDGRGYPSGKRADETPLGARVLAVADAYDAMTTTRPYRAAMDAGAAVQELKRCTGSQFDPLVASVFVEAWDDGAVPTPQPLRAAG